MVDAGRGDGNLIHYPEESPMTQSLLLTVLIVLAIVALLVWIVRR